ncbi:c-type cytochrome [Novispirillum itersonii]|uniref:c-type cytochrome n=1 Tax=Novispirillum itersonii TaxID=189 RepID=UPI000381A658|nr:cytochrome c [Novispirillum itersonii]
MIPRRAGTAAALATLTALIWGSTAAAELPPARKAELAALLTQDCGSCHGLTRHGGLGSPLTAEALRGQDDAVLATIIRDGLPGKPMPPWGPLLSGQDIDWLIHLLRETPP